MKSGIIDSAYTSNNLILRLLQPHKICFGVFIKYLKDLT